MTLKQALKQKNVKEIRKITQATPVAETADLLEKMSPAERVLYFRLLNTKLQVDVFSSLEQEYQEHLVSSFTDKQIKNVIGELFADEIADLVEDVPSEIAMRILKNTDKETREVINKILRYDDEQVGSVMTVDILPLKQSINIGSAINLIKNKKDDIYFGHYFFVTDNRGCLVGSVTIEDLMFNSNVKKIKDIMKPTGSVTTTTSKEEAVNDFAKFDMSVLPVINSSKYLIGVITSDDMIDIAQEVATEDFRKMAGIEMDSDVAYSKTKVRSLFKSRVVWLMLLMISATLSQIVLDVFQNISSNVLSPAIWTTVIVAILPVISGAAGNAGSQSSTMIIRSLAIGDITTKDYLKVIFKELKVSFLIGLSLGIANFLRLIIYYASKGVLLGSDSIDYIFLSLAASISLFIVIVLAKVVGGTLPLLAKKLKFDPAVMAAPLLTTLIDALSTMIFFGISIGIMFLVL